MKFEIGQEVIALENHKMNLFKKGDVFTILSIRDSRCNCTELELDIGFKADCEKYDGYTCSFCLKSFNDDDDVWWVSSKRFAPIERNSWKEVTFEQIKEPAFCCAN